VGRAQSTPFTWGQNDCVTFTSNWFELMTGLNPAARFFGTYLSEREAFEIMLKHGVKSMGQAGEFLFGEPSGLEARSNRGDIVLAHGALGICIGGSAVFATRAGVGFVKAKFFDERWIV
jgi:hypothetical protein